jgi:transposase
LSHRKREEPPVVEIIRIGVDTSKHVFTLHGVDAGGHAVLRRNLSRGQFEAFFAKLSPSDVALEACGASHHWGRRLQGMGHRVRLIPPAYVKPYVKRNKNDAADAAAICEAASRPGMRFVAVKSAEQQAAQMVQRVRELLVKQRTQLANAVRGHAAEFGLVSPKGLARVETLLAMIAAVPSAEPSSPSEPSASADGQLAQEGVGGPASARLPQQARAMFAQLGEALAEVDRQIAEVEATLLALHKASPVSRALAEVPGIGPITAISLVLGAPASQFSSGRHMAAWIGLTPRDHSSGGKQRLGGISRAGNSRLRQLLVLGATAVIAQASKPGRSVSPWLKQLLARKPRKLAAVALANKMARIAWAMMTRGEAFRRQPKAA